MSHSPTLLTLSWLDGRIRRLQQLCSGIDIETVQLSIDGHGLTREEWDGYVGGLHAARAGMMAAAVAMGRVRERVEREGRRAQGI